jgi:excisionase family DNA binding protein
MTAARPATTGRRARGRSRQSQKSDAARAPPASGRLVYTVPEAGRLLGLSRNGSYEAARRGDIPTIRIGRLLVVPKAPFHRMLESTATGTAAPAKEIASKTSKCQDSKGAAAGDGGGQT